MPCRRVIPGSLVLALFCCAAVYAGEEALSPAQYLPESTILSVQVRPWKDWAAAWPETSLSRIAGEKEIRDFLAGPLSKVGELLRGLTEQPAGAAPADPNKQSVAEVIFSTLSDLAPGPAVFALSHTPEQAQTKRPPSAALVLGTRDASQVAAAVQTLLRLFNVQAIKQERYNNAELLVWKTGDYSFTTTFYKNHLVFSSDLDVCQKIVDGMSNALPKSLSARESYRACGLAGHEHMSAFLDVAALRALVGGGQIGAGRLKDALEQSGIGDARAMAWSLRMDGAAFESRTSLVAGEKRSGLLAALDGEALDPGTLKACPAACPMVLGVRVRPDHLVPLLRSLVSLTGGAEGAARFDALQKKYAEGGGDLARDAGEAFSRELAAASYANQEAITALDPRRSTVVSLGVKDAAKADKLLVDLQKRMIAVQNAGAKADDWLKEVEFEGVKIRYIQPPAGVADTELKFALAGDRVLIAADILTMKAALRQLKEKGLADSDGYKKALAGSGGQLGSAFVYVDWGYFYASLFQLGVKALEIVPGKEVLPKAGINLNLLPSTAAVTKHLFPSLATARLSGSTVVLTSRGPLPSAEVLAPPLASLAGVVASFSDKLGLGEKK